MSRSPWILVALIVIAGLLSGVVLVAPPAAAVSTTTWTSTADFDSGTKAEGIVARNFFATNGVSQPNNFINYPSAAYFNGRTYVVYQGSEDGGAHTPDPYATYYDHATATWATPVKIANGPLTDDDHGAPTILVDASGFLHVFYGAHTHPMRYSRSTSPESIAAWTAQPAIWDLLTYPKPILVGSTIYLFVRECNAPGTYCWQDYTASTDGGATWGARTKVVDFGSGGIYAGPMELWTDRVFIEWTWDSGGRQSAYVGYLNTTSATMLCKGSPDTNLGAVIDQTEANASCRIETTAAGHGNFGSVHMDTAGNPYTIYSRTWPSSSWNYRFSQWTGAAWSAAANITTSKHQENHCDFVVTSSSSATALCTRSGWVATGRGGSIEKWTWDGATWTNAGTVLNDLYTLASLNTPQAVFNRDSAVQWVFTEVRTDAFTSADDDSLSLYAYSGTAFVTRADAAGTYGAETTTDDPQVAAGAMELASGKGDAFALADSDSYTTRWHIGRFRSGTDGKTEVTDIATNQAGALYLSTTTGSGGTDAFGVISEFTFTGDFDVQETGERIAADSSVYLYMAIWNEDVLSYSTSGTVDGVMYEQFWQSGSGGDRRFTAYKVTNGAPTGVGAMTQFTGANSFDRNMRITRVGSTITWYYNATGSSSWTQDETTSFSFSGSSHVSIWVSANPTRNVQWRILTVALPTVTLDAGGFLSSGSWTSPTVSAGKLERITLGHSGLSATYAIDAVEVLDGGAVMETFDTDITSGTSTTLTPTLAFRSSPQVRVTLKGDGAGTPILESVEIDVTAGEGVLPGRPVPGFAYDAGLWGCTVSFTDATYGDVNVTEWAWDFGDGATSRERNPVHTFQGCPMLRSSYMVTLEVRTENDQLWVSTRRVEWDRIPLLFVIAIAAAVLAVWGLAVLRREEVRALRRVLRRR